MRAPFVSAIAALFALTLVVFPGNALADPSKEDVAQARALDQEGVKAYREERYRDAIHYFQEARRLGGPPTELWNIAKCHAKLDEPEQAAAVIETYLSEPGLTQSDRTDAQAALDELAKRPSTLTVSSTPDGASVKIDGQRLQGRVTPLSTQLTPGSHSIEVSKRSYVSYTHRVDARYGRAVIVDTELAADSSGEPSRGATGAGVVSLAAAVGIMFPKYGDDGDAGRIALTLRGLYVVTEGSAGRIALGVRGGVTWDSWSNTIGAPVTVASCGTTLDSSFGATEWSLFAMGMFDRPILPRFRVGAELGVGYAFYTATQVGGDRFTPSCSPSFGAKLDGLIGIEGSYSLAAHVRILATPIELTVHPAFDGTRPAPIDTANAWLRAGFSLGVAYDF